MNTRFTHTTRLFLVIAILALFPSPAIALPSSAKSTERVGQRQSIATSTNSTNYLAELSRATYRSLSAMVEPATGLPHDRFDAAQFDITPQFAVIRQPSYVNKAPGASLDPSLCSVAACTYLGRYGLQLTYQMPAGNWGSYNIDSNRFDASQAAYLEMWVKGAQGGERFELVLWSNCSGPFPGRPESALITVNQNWESRRILLSDFQLYADIASLCRLSIGFNDAIHSGGTLYLDQIAFVDTAGNRVHVPLDEETNVTNTGLYIASVIGALERGWENYSDVVTKLDTAITSLETLPKWHGFPQTHNRVLSLTPSSGDRCISTVDMGNLAAGLILLRQRVPELASRAGALLDAMEWDWLYDNNVGLSYGCRYPDGSASTWHYDWLAADSRLANFIGIGTGKMPPVSWSNLKRDRVSPDCSNLWHFEPGWDGGGLFMAFLPGIFLDEARDALGKSARHFTQDQICRAKEIGAPAWGWSATALPAGTYCGYNCLREDILVPHASILAADYLKPTALRRNLRALETLGARPRLIDGPQQIDFGFRASVNWKTGELASVYLFLDQGMAFLSLTNQSTQGRIRQIFCQDPIIRQARALLPDYKLYCSERCSRREMRTGDETSFYFQDDPSDRTIP